MARLPRKVHVMGVSYDINTIPSKKLSKDPEFKKDKDILLGYCHHVLGEIYIDPQHRPEDRAYTLLHEVLHGVDQVGFAGRLFKGHQDNEMIIDQLTLYLIHLFRDNPELAKIVCGLDE